MKTIKTLLVTSFLTLFISTATPAAADERGPECTEDYLLCLNDAYDIGGLIEELAYIECAAGWTGCIVGKLKFW